MNRYNCFLIIFFSALFQLTAQTNVSVKGRVVDEKGAPIFGAYVFIVDSNFATTTNENGQFELTNIPTGSYNITASILGFYPQTKFNYQIKAKGNATINFKLLERSEQLDEIVIDKSNRIQRSKETPLSTQSLSAVEIASIPGGNNDVVRVAQSFPGVSPSVGGFRNDLIIRGGAPNETVYYLDGMEVPNINHFATQGSAGGPVGLLNVSFISDVTLSTSAFGAQYDNPLSGVLQFQQREGNKESFATNVRVSATDAAFTLEGPLFKGIKEESKTSFLVSVRRSYLQTLFELIGLPIRPNYWDYQYKLSHTIDDYNQIYILGLGSIDDFSVEAPDDYDEEAQAVLEQAPFIEQNTNSMGITWKHRFKDNSGFMQSTLSYNRLKNIFTRYEDTQNEGGIIFRNDAVESEYKLRHQITSFVNDWKLNYGFNTQYSTYKNATSNEVDMQYFSSAIDFLKYGVFFNASTSLDKDRFDISIGFRIDYDNYLSDNSLLETFSPRLSLSYQINDYWRISSSVGRYYKLPPYTVLGFQDNTGNLVNKNSKYIESNHYVLGLQYLLNPSANISLEGFYKSYNNYPVSVLDGVSLANKGADFEVLGSEAIETVGKGRSYGLELQYQQKFTGKFYSIFSYTFFYSEFTGFNTSKYLPSVWDSRHLISFVGAYQFQKNWELSGRYRFAGRTPYVPTDLSQSLIYYPEIISDYTRLGEVTLETFSQLDIRIDKKWNYPSWAFNVFFEVQNILAQEIPTPPEYGLSRTDTGEIINPRSLVEIETDTNTPIPSIGIVIDF